MSTPAPTRINPMHLLRRVHEAAVQRIAKRERAKAVAVASFLVLRTDNAKGLARVTNDALCEQLGQSRQTTTNALRSLRSARIVRAVRHNTGMVYQWFPEDDEAPTSAKPSQRGVWGPLAAPITC